MGLAGTKNEIDGHSSDNIYVIIAGISKVVCSDKVSREVNSLKFGSGTMLGIQEAYFDTILLRQSIFKAKLLFFFSF